MSVNNIEGNVNQASAGNNWFQNMKSENSKKEEKNTLPPKEDNAIKISISQEGLQSCQKKLYESGVNETNGKVIVKENKSNIIKQVRQATNALAANNYDNVLAKEAQKLKAQRENSSTYTLSNKAEDYVRAYGNLYDEIVQGYKNGTRERYVEDKTSETGYRKMTMEEELSRLDKAFQRAANRTKTEEMISGEFKRLASKAENKKTSFTDSYKKPQTADKDIQETIGQKMKKLAQVWKDAYKTSGSKENGMEKVLSMINDMFHTT